MQRARERKGMGEVLREAEGLVEVRTSLCGIPSHPQRPGIDAKAPDARVYPTIARGQPAVLRRIIQGNRLFHMGASQDGVAQQKPTAPECIMCLEQQRPILHALRHLEALFAELQRRLMVAAGHIKEPQVPQDWDLFWGLAELLTQGTGPRVGLDDFGGRVAFGRHQCRSQRG